ncbi:MAG: PASTA domain-containing protein [bacterium]
MNENEEYMRRAIEEAKKSVPEDEKVHPKKEEKETEGVKNQQEEEKDGEQKNICFLSIDVVDHSAFSSKFNHNDIDATLVALRKWLNSIIISKKGKELSWAGDGGIFYFLDDKAVDNAVLSSMEIFDQLQNFNTDEGKNKLCFEGTKSDINLRIGIDFGITICHSDPNTWHSEALQTATKIQKMVQPNSGLITPDAYNKHLSDHLKVLLKKKNYPLSKVSMHNLVGKNEKIVPKKSLLKIIPQWMKNHFLVTVLAAVVAGVILLFLQPFFEKIISEKFPVSPVVNKTLQEAREVLIANGVIPKPIPPEAKADWKVTEQKPEEGKEVPKGTKKGTKIELWAKQKEVIEVTDVKEEATPPITTKTSTTTAKVPDVVDMISSQAKDKITADNLLEVSVQTPNAQDDWKVIKQKPEGGEKKPKETEIMLWAKSKLLEVPDLNSKDEERAKEILKNIDLKWDIEKKYSDKPEGTVIEQDPQAGTLVKHGSTVKLTIAKWVEVPKVVGMTLQEARKTITANNLLGVSVETPGAQDNWIVISQDPKPSALVNKGNEIRLWIANPDIGITYRRAIEAKRQSNYTEAIELFSQVLERIENNPKNGYFKSSSWNLVLLYCNQRNYERMISILGIAGLEKDVYYYYYKARALYGVQRYGASAMDFDTAWNRLEGWGQDIRICTDVGLPMNKREATKEILYWRAMAWFMKYRESKNPEDLYKARERVGNCYDEINVYSQQQQEDIQRMYQEVKIKEVK